MITMTKPIENSYFSVDDIRKIRENKSMRYEKMSAEEIVADVREGAERILKILEAQKEK